MYQQSEKNLLNSNTSSQFRPTNGWDRFTSLGHPCKFQRVYCVTAGHSRSGRQPNFAALNRGRHRHLYSAGRPSCWALTHILVSLIIIIIIIIMVIVIILIRLQHGVFYIDCYCNHMPVLAMAFTYQVRIQDCGRGLPGGLSDGSLPVGYRGKATVESLGTKGRSPQEAGDLLQIRLQWCSLTESNTIFCRLSIKDGGLQLDSTHDSINTVKALTNIR